jgi:hypothetical protein
MHITVIHGDTTIQISGKHNLKKMKKAVRDIFGYLPEQAVEEEPEANPIGFSLGATVERAETVEYIWDDEEE